MSISTRSKHTDSRTRKEAFLYHGVIDIDDEFARHKHVGVVIV